MINCKSQSGIETATFLFVGQYLNQLRHRVPHPVIYLSDLKPAPYEGRKSATLINKSYEYRPIKPDDKTVTSFER
jgi:hypothetical protein